MKYLRLSLLIFCLTTLFQSSCATGDAYGGDYTYAPPDPLEQQIRMQEEMSRVTRSLIPF